MNRVSLLSAMLGTCTGGADYYDELAGPALERANFLINRVPWTTGTDPYKALSGGTHQRDSRDHIFGCLIAPLIPKEIRANSLAPVAKIGVYLGSSEKTPGAIESIILAQITFDYGHICDGCSMHQRKPRRTCIKHSTRFSP